MRDKVIITGLGCISGAGKNLAETMDSFYAGKRSPKPPQRISFKLEKDYPVFEVTNLEGQTDELSLYFAETAIKEALTQAELNRRTLEKSRVGVFLGSTAGCFFNREDYYRQVRNGQCGDAAYLAHVLMNGSIAHRINKKWNLTGPALTISNACASGTDAIGLAAAMIARGECDIALAGGCDELVRMVYLGFISLMNTSGEPCRPFSKRRTGLNLGEGAGICVLESHTSVKQRGARPLGIIAGYATAADAYHVTAPEPSGRGLRTAFNQALGQAGVKPEAVAFINTHGTGTSENDRVEGHVIADLFGRDMPITATKAYTGHALGAAGGLEAVFSTRFLIDQQIPGVPDDHEYDPDCAIQPHIGVKTISGNYACSSSLAFGGVNSVLIIGRPL